MQRQKQILRVCPFTWLATQALVATVTAQTWTPLFDGNSLQGWTPRGSADLKVVNSEMHLSADKNVWVVSDRRFADFIMEVDVKVPDGEKVNSGIAFRCQGSAGKPRGYQCEIDGSKRAWTGGLHAIGHGWIHPDKEDDDSVDSFLLQARGSFKPGKWNRYRIDCRGDRIRISVNGVLITDVRDVSFHEGFVGIQHHGGGGTYQFRRLRIRPLETQDLEQAMQRIPPRKPDEALPTFKVGPGFRIEQVAAEPLVSDPVSIAFDEAGRMFVAEFPEYNHRHAGWKIQHTGLVRLLEDTDQDGKFDRSTVYVDRLPSPTSVACYDGGIIVTAAPQILFCKDTDGDGQADVRRVLFDGFGISEKRGGGGRLNSLVWGLDQRFHVATSFSGGEVLSPAAPDAEPINVRNRGFAFDPRTLRAEATSGSGQHGLAIDDWGHFFNCRNSDPFSLVMYESRYVMRNPYLKGPPESLSLARDGKFTQLKRISRVQPWRIIRTARRTQGLYRGSNEGGAASGFFTSATGVTVYRGDAWPEEYRGNIFVGEVSNNLVHRARLIENGIELVAEPANQEGEFLASTDMWFRPVGLANGPDGNLYVIDMYRELIETALALPPDVLKQLSEGGGVRRGRIYRVVSEKVTPRSRQSFGSATTAELVTLLKHPNGWHRDTASRLLHQRQDPAAVRPLQRVAAQADSAEGRLVALYCLAGQNALETQTVLTSLADPSAHVRQHAVRLSEQLLEDSAELRNKLLRMTDDASLSVRYQLALTLGELPPADADARVASLAKLATMDSADSWMRFAILTSMSSEADRLLETLLADENYRDSESGRRLLVSLMEQIGAACRQKELATATQCLETLPVEQQSLRRQLVRALFEAQGRSKRKRILDHGGDRISGLLEELLTYCKAKAIDETLPLAERVRAIKGLALGSLSDTSSLIRELLTVQQAPEIRAAAMQALSGYREDSVAELVLPSWQSFSPQLRAQASQLLLSRRIWVQQFLDAVEEGSVASSDIDRARLSLLRKYPDEDIRQRVSVLFERTGSQRSKVIDDYQVALQSTGDVMRGKAVFKRVCAKCHRLDGVGEAIGAELTAMRDRGPAALLLNILDPNREVKPKFVGYVLQTLDGRVLSGMISSENANAITLRLLDGTTVQAQRNEIKLIRSTGTSFMPEGLERELDHQAMADLLAYLGEAN